MNQLVDIPATPSAALRKLREGLSECGLFIFSAPCKGLCLALGAARLSDAREHGHGRDPRGHAQKQGDILAVVC